MKYSGIDQRDVASDIRLPILVFILKPFNYDYYYLR